MNYINISADAQYTIRPDSRAGREEGMELTLKGIQDKKAWEAAGIALPSYDVEAVAAASRKNPMWVHFGIGNIFRIFLGGICDRLLNEGLTDRGITCAETFDYDLVDMIYDPYDNLGLSVILNNDGTREIRVLGSMTEAVRADASRPECWARLKEIFENPGLQMVSFTITEKGYALRGTDGNYFPFVAKDIENGPEKPVGAMGIIAAMLAARFAAGAAPLALVSMDNCSQNGSRLRGSVLEMAGEWQKRGFLSAECVSWMSDESKVAFPWTMIDKITPRPAEQIADDLEKTGVARMQPVITGKHTYIAPFINAERAQYLVVEDSFPNGRPPLEKAGVYMTDRDTVSKSERMKVTVCLNPIHSALGPAGVMLGYDLFSDVIVDPDLRKLAERVGYAEGMEVVPDPGILSPEAFIGECLNERFPNPYLGDTCLRLCVDISQGISIRFGETIKSYCEKFGSAEKLTAIPLALALWLRYILAADDAGRPYELAPDPLNRELTEKLSGIRVGAPETVGDTLRPILSNNVIFGTDLYEAGVGEKVEEIFTELTAGPGAVRSTIRKVLAD